jgi:hypothetical protein
LTTQQIVIIVGGGLIVLIVVVIALRAIAGKGGQMRYKFTLQEHDGSWVYVLNFGSGTPTSITDVIAHSDNSVSAEDLHGIRHHVYMKNGKIVSIHLHGVPRILPHLNPEHPESVRMPGMQAIMFGDPPVPTLLLLFKEEPPDTQTAYALSPNVFLVFQDGELAQLYVTDAPAMIPGAA